MGLGCFAVVVGGAFLRVCLVVHGDLPMIWGISWISRSGCRERLQFVLLGCERRCPLLFLGVLSFIMCRKRFNHSTGLLACLRTMCDMVSSAAYMFFFSWALFIDHAMGNAASAPLGVGCRSACNTVVPKLVSQDYALFASLLNGVFPGCQVLAVPRRSCGRVAVFVLDDRGSSVKPCDR